MHHATRITTVLLTFSSMLAVPRTVAQTAVVDWLVLGPLPAPASPGSAGTGEVRGKPFAFGTTWPSDGTDASWFNGQTYRWERRAATDGALSFADSARSINFAVAYLTTDRWQKVTIELDGNGERRAWLDGGVVTGEISMSQGTHWLLVEVRPVERRQSFLTATIKTITPNARLTASTSPRRAPTLAELEALPSVTGVKADPSGGRAAFTIRSPDIENDRWISTMEIRDLRDGHVIREMGLTTQAMNPTWSRDGSRLAFTAITDRQDGAGFDIWVWEPGQRGARRVLRNEPGVASLEFSADGSWLYFTGTVKPDSGKNTIAGASRYTDVWERWSNWQDKAQLYAVHVEQGTRVTLAGGTDYSVVGPTLSRDGQTFVYGREVRFAERPFLRSELWLLDVGTLESRKLIDLPQQAFAAPQAFAWSRGGDAIAFCGSAKNVLDGEDPQFSVFEVELYGVPLDRPRLVHLSDGFVPNLGFLGCTLTWKNDGRIYMAAQDGARTVMARTTSLDASFASPGLEMLPLPAGETMGAHDVTDEVLITAVESPVTPQTVHRMNLGTGTSRPLFNPAGNALAQTEMPGMREWDFTDSEGWNIEGWYLTPPDFDPANEYPAIVWYYGGTAATLKTFDRRLAAYAAQGYVVYVLNPAGAPGWGQDFSNLHINDWGYPAGSDIIEGVTKFAAEHAFVDEGRIGNFGHSYGGFMTMHMATRTDVFAASASIAGISNIANYWGAGWWGYSYTDGTCPGCYPWNRRDVYVERSPLFQADRIDTPMLLIHGTDDTNVVPTESEQMFTALRVLNKVTELIRFPGENHGVNSKPSVQHDRDMMLFEWFDRFLRNRPDAWLSRWGAGEEPKVVDTTTP